VYLKDKADMLGSAAIQKMRSNHLMMAKMKANMMKAAIILMFMAFKTIGIPLQIILRAIIPDPIAFFIPQNNEPNFDELRRYHANPEDWECHRQYVENSVNNKLPKWQATLRVPSLPTPDELYEIVQSKRPNPDNVAFQVTLKFNPSDESHTSKIEFHYFDAAPFLKEKEEDKRAAMEAQTKALEAKQEANKGKGGLLGKASNAVDTAKLKVGGPQMEQVIKPKQWKVAPLERCDRGAPFSLLLDLPVSTWGYKWCVHKTDGSSAWFFDASVPIEGGNDDGKFSLFTVNVCAPFGLGFRGL
jgi:hypothetical protein